MKCKKCKTENPPNAVECINCGNRLVTENVFIPKPRLKNISVHDAYLRRSVFANFLNNKFLRQLIDLLCSNTGDRHQRKLITTYLISLIPTAGLIKQKKYLRAYFYIMGLIVLYFLIYYLILYQVSNFFIIAMVILLVYIMYEAVLFYYLEDRKIRVSFRMKISIALTSLGVFTVFIILIYYLFFNIVAVYDSYYHIFPANSSVLLYKNRLFPAVEKNKNYYVDLSLFESFQAYFFRIIAVPGDTIELRPEGGLLLINDQIYRETDAGGYRSLGSFPHGRYKLNAGEYLAVQLDYGNYLSIIREQSIIGEPIAIIRPTAQRKRL